MERSSLYCRYHNSIESFMTAHHLQKHPVVQTQSAQAHALWQGPQDT